MQGSGTPVQGNTVAVQGNKKSIQGNKTPLQVTTNPNNVSMTPSGGAALGVGAEVAQDDAGSGVDAQAALDAARAGQLRGEITTIANSIKDIFNSRYGLVTKAGQEQTGNLNKRFNTESADVGQQVEGENQALGAAHAASGSFDSSYRGNNVDTVTKAGERQVRDLGTELEENINSIATWVNQQKAGFDSQKKGIDSVISRLAESTDPNELTQIRNTLESRISELGAGGADYNTAADNRATVQKIAPSNARAVKLQTTLSQIVAGNADPAQKAKIGQQLIASAGLAPEDAQKLLTSFQGDLNKQQPVV
jgi:hypothetical protein